jgi:[acyl-carrier-protein] S-malonyltransferase
MLDYVPENDTFSRLVDAAEALSGLDLEEISRVGEAEDLADTRVAQPLLYLTDWAWGVALLESGLEPVAVAGHSLGEFAALAIAGVFSPEAGLELVIERSKLMATQAHATAGSMAAVLGMDSSVLAAAIEGISGVWVANDNSPGQVVISGSHHGIEAATAALSEAGARRIVPLKVAGAFHSPLMEPAREAFQIILDSAELRDASIPVLQNTDPKPSVDSGTIRDRLARQITEPVRWTQTMQELASGGPIVLVETGPGSVLRGLTRGVPDMSAVSVEDAGIEQIREEVLRA